jgi:T5SS/PEP-CTERM-associated repeat protein
VTTEAAVAPGGVTTLTVGTDLATNDSFIALAPESTLLWTGALGTDYGTASDWLGGIAPTSSDLASFGGNAGTVTGSGSALGITVGGSGTWNFDGLTLAVAALSTAVFSAPGITFDTSAVLDASTLAVNGVVDISATNGVTVTAEGGSTITTLGDEIGSDSGMTGALVVTGAGTTWDEQAGGVGLDLTEASYDAGSVTVTDGATLVSQAPVQIGNSYLESSSITVADGGQWTIEGTAGVLDGVTGDGMLAVNGGTVTDAGFITVGADGGGNGTLAVTNGTIATAGDFNVGLDGAGVATIGQGGTVFDGGMSSAIGYASGSTGSLVVNAGGTFAATAPAQMGYVLRIGQAGSEGAVAPAQGAVLVTGTGALLTTNGSPLDVGGDTGGDGTLTVSQGGALIAGTPDSANAAAFVVAGGTLSSGTVTIDGPGSTLTSDGYALIGRGGTASLLIENSASMVVNQDPTGDGDIGIGAGGYSAGQVTTVGSGSVTVTTGGLLDISSPTGEIMVGAVGASGTLTVNAGTVVSGEHLVVGNAASLAGTLYAGTGVVRIGAAGTLELTNPSTAGFSIEIGPGGSAGPTNTASGTVTVSGAGALLNGNDGGLEVGRLADGSLTVSQGGNVESGSPNDALFNALAIGRQGDGSVTVTDPGSTFTANGGAAIGRAGTGSLTVENAGSLFVGEDGTGNGGIAIGGAGFASATTQYVGGTGAALVTTGGDLFSQLNVTVGGNGVSGSLTVGSDGTVEAGTSVIIGDTATLAAGQSEISSSGTDTVSAATLVGGTGTITVGAGGVLLADGTGIAGTADLDVGAGTGSSGTLDVSGARALASSSNGMIVVGDAGTGTLNVTDDGVVNAGTNEVDIGAQSGGVGTVDVGSGGVGLGGTLEAGSLLVGNLGSGSLDVANGGLVAATQLMSGVGSTAAGGISVTGTASALTLTGALVVGDAAPADLSIFGGATVTAQNVTLGLNVGGGGTIDLAGTGSALDVTNSLNIGSAGTGSLAMGTNTTLAIANQFVVGSNGVSDASGGVLDPASMTNDGSVTGGDGAIANVSATLLNNGEWATTLGDATLNVGTPGSEGPQGGAIEGTGSLLIANGGDLIVNAATVSATQSVVFTNSDTAGILTIGMLAGFAAVIGSFNRDAEIIVAGTSIATVSFADNTLTLFGPGNSELGTLTFAADAVSAGHLATNTAGAVIEVACFATGTRIATEHAEVAVETIREGDKVRALLGDRLAPVIWVGRREVDCARHPAPRKVWPVRVAPGAFGPGRPHTELFLSPDHAVFVGEVLIPIRCLINGSTIVQVPVERVTYHHIELAQHDVLLAQGLPAESFLDMREGTNYANRAGPVRLYPDYSARMWEAFGCARLIVTGPELAAARALVARFATTQAAA